VTRGTENAKWACASRQHARFGTQIWSLRTTLCERVFQTCMFAREAKQGFFVYTCTRVKVSQRTKKVSCVYILLGEMARARMALELDIGRLNRALLILSTKVRH
jgi:hypothetical protein